MHGCDFITTDHYGTPWYCHREVAKNGRCHWHQPSLWDRVTANPFVQFLQEFFNVK